MRHTRRDRIASTTILGGAVILILLLALALLYWRDTSGMSGPKQEAKPPAGSSSSRGATVAPDPGSSTPGAAVAPEPPPRSTPTVIPAFPGAEGYGAVARGGRGGRVLEVTNLNDSGPGSLRAAVEAEGRRIVVFRVAGEIKLEEPIQICAPYLTIAGQTAHGSGITLRGATERGVHGLFEFPRNCEPHDIVIRYLRLRQGGGRKDTSTNVAIFSGHNIILDHLSIGWARDNNVSIYREGNKNGRNTPPIHDVTIQRSIIAEALSGHSTGLNISGYKNYSDPANPAEDYKDIYDITVHHNLFAHNSHRNPRNTSSGTQVINNVVYNWRSRVASTTRASVTDFINNYYKAGPMSSDDILYHESSDRWGLRSYPDPSLYLAGNFVEAAAREQDFIDALADNQALIREHWTGGALPQSYFRAEPLPGGAFPVSIQPAREAYASVLSDVGANARLDCLGNWVSNADSVDRRVLEDLRAGSGPHDVINDPEDVGGYPEVEPGTPCADTDHDGMPDEWETLHGFDPGKSSDGVQDADFDGYTNLEEFLNGTDPKEGA